MMPFDVVLFSRPGCCLCDRVAELLQSLSREFPHELRVVDIDGDPILRKKWRSHIPVIYIDGGHRLALRITEDRVRRAFSRAAQKRGAALHK